MGTVNDKRTFHRAVDLPEESADSFDPVAAKKRLVAMVEEFERSLAQEAHIDHEALAKQQMSYEQRQDLQLQAEKAEKDLKVVRWHLDFLYKLGYSNE